MASTEYFVTSLAIHTGGPPRAGAGGSPRLLLSEVNTVLLVIAEVFKNVGVGHESVRDPYGKWFGVHLGIVKRHFDIHVSEVAAEETFRDLQPFAMRVPRCIQCGFVVEPSGLHHQRVALPMSGRIAQISREIDLLGKAAPVGVDLATQVLD